MVTFYQDHLIQHDSLKKTHGCRGGGGAGGGGGGWRGRLFSLYI